MKEEERGRGRKGAEGESEGKREGGREGGRRKEGMEGVREERGKEEGERGRQRKEKERGREKYCKQVKLLTHQIKLLHCLALFINSDNTSVSNLLPKPEK